MLRCVQSVTENVNNDTSDAATKMLPSLKSLEYLIKFIIASRLNFTKAQNSDKKPVGMTDDEFKAALSRIFDDFNKLMTKRTKEFAGAQSLALKVCFKKNQK